jgi:hypothetical protein
MLMTLCRVFRVETGAPGGFDRPATAEQALDRLERNAGAARQMLERFLKRRKRTASDTGRKDRDFNRHLAEEILSRSSADDFVLAVSQAG